MSHKATNWALQQKGLKPATKLVLFYLADRHNPDYGCFPSQTTLADDCEMSLRSVRNHLDILECLGLLSRTHRKTDSGNYTSDRYMLGFELHPAAKSADGKKQHEPAANSAAHHRQNLPPNPVKVKPVIEPVKETVVSVLSEICSFEVAMDFADHRRALKSPMTLQAARMLRDKLLKGTMTEADAAMCRSIENGWKGVFPESMKGGHNVNGNSNDATLESIARAARAR